ncbi:Site-specific recombinase XerD [Sphingomonas sp. EC-HK361]|uniref:tyrosine-type recombinase/integrase n=1 Tax=Sphingomonas sp. EC-HK361 TaxID=2038397 RepID=UPI0012592309|nr:site-specific integrase [Sphingomonas sp. EC-HK361]VVT16335.1 Site-specific recombinase XerD [Sphingomonas sp. EC-HK361]
MPRPNNGPGLKFLRKRGVFYIQWYDAGNKRQRSTGTNDRGEAEARLAEFIIERGKIDLPRGPRDPSQFPIADALALYGAEHAPTTAAPERIAYAIDALLPFWGASMVSAITQETCRAYTRERKRSPGTIRKELGTLRASLHFAQRYGRLTAVPHVFLPSKPEGRGRWLSRTEAAQLIHAAVRSRSDTRLYLPLFLVIALYTGARKEAILSLRWPQIDLDRGIINFNPPGRKRTSKGRPILPIPDRLMTFLRLARRRGSDLGYVVHRNGHRITDIGDARSGSFGRACTRAGLADTGVVPHTLRHTCGTWMAQAGVSMFEIGGWLGQSVARTTELYAHHSPDHLASARRAADRRA